MESITCKFALYLNKNSKDTQHITIHHMPCNNIRKCQEPSAVERDFWAFSDSKEQIERMANILQNLTNFEIIKDNCYKKYLNDQ